LVPSRLIILVNQILEPMLNHPDKPEQTHHGFPELQYSATR